MTSLKQEMRQMFEKRSAMAFYENNNGFEEGLLEKIVNLAYANLSPYSSKRWNIIAVKSPVLLHKLYKTANDRRIADSAIALIVCDAAEDGEKLEKSLGSEDCRDLDLLEISVGFASKYYCIDYFTTRAFDRDLVSREFALSRQQPAAAIICLGYFRDKDFAYTYPAKNLYSDTVRIL